jgi:hypothetical protein
MGCLLPTGVLFFVLALGYGVAQATGRGIVLQYALLAGFLLAGVTAIVVWVRSFRRTRGP